ncbi:MAG: aldehyde dehydrogenase family protein, partial [Acidimicrobiales bacterium]|nr:aldehyde dehydrogenase family protein [Acidimicrobiales bacterium]
NASEDNFLRHLFTLKSGSDEFSSQAQQFRHAVATRWEVSSTPRRHEIKNLNKEKNFFNQPDTDPSLNTTQEWIKSISGQTPQKIKTQITTSVEDIQRFITEAKDAQNKWIQIPIAERQNILRQVAEEILKRKNDLFVTMAHEAGKTWTEIDAEINEAVDFARWYAERSTELDQLKYAEFTPLGVLAVVPPWNFPTAIPTGGVLASLAAGNGVIFKPAPETPRCAEIIAEACWAAGVPEKLLQFVRTRDDDVGKHLVISVDGVILTGSVETADLFRSWKPDMFLSAETSGKNALIVTPQADLDLAAADLVRSAFGHQGQKCSAASLGILVDSVATDERFLRQIVDAAKSLIVGHSYEPETTFGPLISPASGKLLHALTTLEEGEYWLLEPRQIDSAGKLWTPGIKGGVQPNSPFHHTEYFGPVLGLMAASNLDQALEWQNAVDYGLTGGIHSLDPTEIETWLDKVQVGNAYINRHITGAIVNRQPFGGWKRSTVGSGAKAGGPDYLLQLGNWSPTDPVGLDVAQLDDDYWWDNHYNIDQDPSGLFCEANILRYKPQPNLIVRISSDAKEKEVERALSAINRCGTTCIVSREEEISNSDFAASLSSYRFGRIRLLGSTTEEVRAAAIQAEIHLVDEPVTSSGRLELRWYVREQAISWTLHRFGNLVNAATA